MNNFYILGIIGLLLIIFGVLIKNRDRKTRDAVYILGGLSLLAYSFYIRDTIFIILQIVFVLVAIYDIYLQKHQSGKRK